VGACCNGDPRYPNVEGFLFRFKDEKQAEHRAMELSMIGTDLDDSEDRPTTTSGGGGGSAAVARQATPLEAAVAKSVGITIGVSEVRS
jgi:hypothetical protein